MIPSSDDCNESWELARYRASLPDDRQEYKNKMKHGKKYKEFMGTDDRDDYKNRMKYGKKGSSNNT